MKQNAEFTKGGYNEGHNLQRLWIKVRKILEEHRGPIAVSDAVL